MDEENPEHCETERWEEQLDMILNDATNQRELFHGSCSVSKTASVDEFKQELEAELGNTMKHMEAKCMGISYEPQKEEKPPVESADELLYDPEMDNADQKWIDQFRQQYQPKGVRNRPSRVGGAGGPCALPTSDAILNCPCCMTSLCLDCQRHASYQHQYRAMFVMNCTVRTDQVLHFPQQTTPEKKRSKGKRAKKSDSSETSSVTTDAAEAPSDDDTYHPVVCSECGTEVGVYDRDEVYHFFNVLASHS